MKGQNYNRPVRRMLCVLPAAAVLLGIMVLGGCSGTENNPITVNSAAAIAQESDVDYDNNVNGLISGTTMMYWLDNWRTNRPAGITGKLVIFQTGNGGTGGIGANGWGDTGREFLKYNDINIFTYAVPNGAWVQTRSNGVVFTGSMVADGTQMDALLKLYNIDPAKDMIVFAMGKGGTGANMIIGRGWYMFRYWGIDKKNLAILNGGIDGTNIISAGYFNNTPSVPPNTGTAVISQIRVDNTALQASLEEMMTVAAAEGADDTQTTVPAGGAFILDARGNNVNEYNGVQYATGDLSIPVCGDNGARTCEVAFEGHIAGALPDPGGFNFSSLLDSAITANAFMYLPKATIKNLIDNTAGYGIDNTVTVYTYCRTTYRAMVTGIATGVILGYPTKFYDGGWIEWGQMANTLHSSADGTGGLSGTPNLPADSPWRTDNLTVSWRGVDSWPSRVYPLTVVDPYAPDANALINEDKAYKWGGESTDEAPGGGGGGGGCG